MKFCKVFALTAAEILSRGLSGPPNYSKNIRLQSIALPGTDPVMSTWSVYLLRCADGSLYTGIATDVSRRLAEHQEGDKGAKYLRGRGPLQLVFHQQIGNRSLATKIEHRIKRLPKECKEDIGGLPDRIEELMKQISPQVG